MSGFAWVLFVLVLVIGVLLQVFKVEPDPVQRIILFYPAFIAWAVWSVGYLLGIKRRPATLKALGRFSYRLRCFFVMRSRRRRLLASTSRGRA